MKLQGKRIAILAENMYQEMELWVPYYRFKEEGAEVKVVGAGGAKSYTSKHGYPVSVDVQADQVKAVEFDAVVVPGGYAPDLMRRHTAMVSLVREAAQQGKVVADRRRARQGVAGAKALETLGSRAFTSNSTPPRQLDRLLACAGRMRGAGRESRRPARPPRVSTAKARGTPRPKA
jgi:putative intracellular protease/amidase